ncbi:DNA-directed RNA polymerase subunit alpha [Candidatus Giovannonibacteria bacterium]|nr:DNA-directed RNA polymerase subunit alpha [Candidatus Giovannonibacteria bacterium]
MIYTINIPSRPRAVSEEGFKGVYEIDALHPGYGHTLGNSIRRVLLSSLSGAAITRVQIGGISHEFSTLPDVKEDMISLLLNLKQVRFLMHADDPQTIRLSVKGVKKVTAKDFEAPTQLEIVNPDTPIATLTSKDAKLEIEARVERGLGYVPREVLEKEKSDIGSLTLDAVFTPIRRVHYEVENMRVGERTDYNRLRFTIETDGTILPREAFSKSIDILVKQLEALSFLQEEKKAAKILESEPEAAEPEAESVAVEDSLKIRIEDLGLSGRAQNALANAGIRTVGGVVKKSREDLLELEGIGEKAVSEIEKALKDLGLELQA